MLDSHRAAQTLTVCCLATLALFGGSATAAADPADDQANNDRLAALIPASSGSCQVSNHFPEDPFLARVGCGQNSQPGGPNSAVYSLYGSPADMDATFGRLAAAGDPVACPGSAGTEPVPWGGGMMVCTTASGPRDGAPTVSWTKAADLFVGSGSGDDLAALYAWWLAAR